MKKNTSIKGPAKLIIFSLGLFFVSFQAYAQTVETDIFKPDTTLLNPVTLSLPEISTMKPVVPMMEYVPSLPELGSTMIAPNGVRIVPENLKLPSPFTASPYLYQARNTTVGPFRMSYQDQVQGGDVFGINARHNISDRFWVGGSVHAANSYFGMLQPTRQWNGAVNLSSGYWVSDWLMVYGYGQYGMHSGSAPAGHSPMIPGKAYGGGMQIKLTEHFGVGVQVNREYWMGKWKTTYNYYPVIYK